VKLTFKLSLWKIFQALVLAAFWMTWADWLIFTGNSLEDKNT